MPKDNVPIEPLTQEELDALFDVVDIPTEQPEAHIESAQEKDQASSAVPEEDNPEVSGEEYVVERPKQDIEEFDIPIPDKDEEERKRRNAFFSEEMTAEEIAKRYIAAIDASEEPSIVMTVNGVEMEGVKEEFDNAEKKAARLDPNKFKDDIKGVNVYLNGKQIKIDQLVAFIEANKAEFVAACQHAFPDIEQKIEAKREREAAEASKDDRSRIRKEYTRKDYKPRRSFADIFKKRTPEHTPAAKETGTPVPAKVSEPTKQPVPKETAPINKETEAYVPKKEEAAATSLKASTVLVPAALEPARPKAPETEQPSFGERLNLAAQRLSLDEIADVMKFFEGPKKYIEADFYLQNPKTQEVEHVIKLKKTGGENRILIDGKNSLESDLKRLMSEYPGQMHKQMEAQQRMNSVNKEQTKGTGSGKGTHSKTAPEK